MGDRGEKRKITTRDIAREANVSVATVSRIINGNGPVSEATRERVQAVIDKHSFRPNALARSLFMKKSKMIGFMIPDITNLFFAQLCLEVEKAALEFGYSVFLCNSINELAIESKYLETLLENQVDGIILAGGRINQTKTRPGLAAEMQSLLGDVPLVMINGDMPGVSRYRIRSDEFHAIDTMVDYLVSLGHRDIALLGGYEGITSFDIKLKALRQAQDRYPIRCLPDWIRPSDFTIEGGLQSMGRLLQQDRMPSAAIAINDLVALGAMRRCRSHGVRVPEDLSIIGFDDIRLAGTSSPALTTMAHPYREMGLLAVQTIHALMQGERPHDDILLETRLVIRDSCRPKAAMNPATSQAGQETIRAT